MKNGKCVCQICTCGRHRCPHSRGSIGDAPIKAECVVTEYNSAFEKWPYTKPRESMRPAMRSLADCTPMQMKTMYNQTFVKHELSKVPTAKPARRSGQYAGKPMELLTTYTRDYTGSPTGVRPDSFKPENKYHASGTKFHTNTMYKVSYIEHGPNEFEWCRAKPIKHKECIQREDGKIEQTTVMKEDFKHHDKPERAVLAKPQPNNNNAAGKFDNNTMYKQEYTEKKVDRAKVIKPPNNELLKSKSPFHGDTTFKTDYKPISDFPRTASYKPLREYSPQSVKFETETTASRTYVDWPAKKPEKPVWAKQKQYEVPTCGFHSSSSYQDDYTGHDKYDKAILAKPLNTDLYLGQDTSNVPKGTLYQEQFVQYAGAHKPKSFKKVQRYEPPKEAFESESAYQANYTGSPAQPAALCIPARNPIPASRIPMNFGTTYISTFDGEKPKPCPAKDLSKMSEKVGIGELAKTVNGNLTLVDVKNGHRYFKGSDGSPKTAPASSQ